MTNDERRLEARDKMIGTLVGGGYTPDAATRTANALAKRQEARERGEPVAPPSTIPTRRR